jgi:two-component system chemotaxis response regulator CheB
MPLGAIARGGVHDILTLDVMAARLGAMVANPRRQRD